MKWIPIFPLLLLTINNLFAQTPEKISYQAVIRDNSQALVTSSDVDLKIIVRQGSTKGTAVYEETHYTTTNSNGLVSLQIGTGIVNSGSFANINWAKGSYYIESQVDPTGSSNYTITGVSQILSVPYSLHSKTTEHFAGTISEAQISDLYHYSDGDINGFEVAFEGWDKDVSDDFDGKYSSLTGLPDIYTKSEIMQLLSGNETPGRFTQSLTLTETELSISGGNSISFENWDRDVSDDFSGNYADLKNKPQLFSGDFNDLINTPDSFSVNFEDLQGLPRLYTKSEIDSLMITRSESEGSIQSLNLEGDQLSISGGNTISLGELTGDFSGSYLDLEDRPELFSGDFTDLANTPEIFSGDFADLDGIPQLYTKSQVDSLVVTRSGSEGTIQSLNLEGDQLSISGGNTISLGELTGDFPRSYLDLEDRPELFSGDFADLANTPEIFSGDFADLDGIPQLYTKSQVDSLVVTRSGSEGSIQSLNLEGDQLSISGGNTISLGELTGDFSGSYLDLEDRPELFSGEFADLANTPEIFSGDFADLDGIPQLYTKSQVDSLVVTRSGSEGTIQSLNLEGYQLSISGGNTISLGELTGNFSGSYLDLEDRPEIYNRVQVDSLIVTRSGSEGTIQSLNLEGDQLSISGGNTISLGELTGDFPGSYLDLEDRPELFSGDFADLTNTPEIFSGNFADLKDVPLLYTRSQVDSLIVTIESSEGVVQSLSMEGDQLSISGGNTISLGELTGDFSVSYLDLEDRPELFSGEFADLTGLPQLYTKSQVDSLIVTRSGSEGVVQSLSLEGSELKISGGNGISFEGWDMNSSDDFSGDYLDLRNLPQIYTTSQVDSLVTANASEGGTVQALTLEESRLSISGGNTISFEKWDTNAADDFSGFYDDLQNKPELFNGEFNALKNLPNLYTAEEVDNLINGIETNGGVSQNLSLDQTTLSISGGNSISFENWDTNASDDFSGSYIDLQNKPELYNKSEIDNLLQNIETTGASPQNLNLEGETLCISEGNSISFQNWDTNASDDFSGIYNDLKNIPEQYTKSEVDVLISNVQTTGSQPQILTLAGRELLISNGNSIIFDNWDTNAADDFNGEYSNLKNAPKVYTQVQVDSIKADLLEELEKKYTKKAKIIDFSSSRTLKDTDIENTVVCKTSATLNIPSNFDAMAVGQTINLEIHGTTLTISGNSGVTLNGNPGGSKSLGNSEAYTGGILRKTGTNTYVVL
ncbi:hypothetical protein RM545_06205 [Zunongwangia sp. F260]|uniref:Uncharacterized protein n=1 Tax=Autumnicola lenta TaxID=3075593 RepID=A0ABU3CJ09_9FLAO|nr:hypothetical protein [Zunongwangia sp. F260]MDT0646276.1 hypothetical protein [Zunongwangia sp. F260]